MDDIVITLMPMSTALDLLERGLGLLHAGDLAGARAAFQETRRALEALGEASPDAWLRLSTAQARLARTRGQASDAAAYLGDGQRVLETSEGLTLGAVAGHQELRAVVAIERGAHRLAERLLAEGLPGARAAGSDWSLRFHRLLGALHTRRGRPDEGAHHYRLALDLLDWQDQPSAAGALVANLAMCSFMAGRLAEAEAQVVEALGLKGVSAAGPRANSLALLALIRTAAGVEDTADLWSSALALARSSADRTLIAELELLAAAAAARAGNLERARALHPVAAETSHQLRRQEPMLGAMALETEAAVARAAGEQRAALDALVRARDAFWELGAVYHAAQVDTQRALVERDLGRIETAHARLDVACKLALRGGFSLRGGPPLDGVLRSAGAAGHPGVRGYLERGGHRLRPRLDGVLLDPWAGVIVVDGVRHGQRRNAKPMLLLRALLDARPGAIGGQALCRRIWPGEDFDRRVYGRLKVLIFRLRALLDPDRHAILTVPGGPTRWRWNPDVPARIGRVDNSEPAGPDPR